MLFSSITFLFAFLPLVILVYYAVPRSFRNGVLFVFSLVFYAWGEPVYVLLMLASITVAYITGLLADRKRREKEGKNSRGVPRAALIFALVWNIGLLLFFKYTGFFIDIADSISGGDLRSDIINSLNKSFGLGIKEWKLSLPIGISFYSFQTLSYVIDVYRGNVKSQRNFLNLATYVALFPQLIAGPIVRYIDVDRQLVHRRESLEKFSAGVKRFCIGLGKKVILANAIGELFEAISSAPADEKSVCGAWLGIIAYTFQIYFDFSGYSDMAIGLGKMFGFDFLENFNYPYISDSITEFWRRWHISLSSWFRDYVYIPLGGNRKGKARQILNIMVVWFLTGFWHGANWNFMLWGVYFGVILILEKTFLLKLLAKCPKFIRHIYALLLIVLGWGIFAFEDTAALVANLKALIGLGGLPPANGKALYWFGQNWALFVILIIASTPLAKSLGEKFKKNSPVICGYVAEPLLCAGLLIVSAAYLAGNSFNPFMYFRF